MMLRRVFLIAIFAVGMVAASHAASLQTFEKSSLAIATKAGPQRFEVELALTPDQQMQGLMYRSQLAPDAGMLFDFVTTAPRAFWMKNTLIPLDMLFIAADGRIVDIHERAVPLSESVIPSNAPARAVLELNGGTVDRLGIKIGDTVSYKGFGTGGA